jgi:hypothetical protein
MKTRYFKIIAIVIVAGSLLTGFCINGYKYVKDYQDKDKQAHEGQKKESGIYQEWKDFKSNADIQINVNEKRIGELKVKIKASGKNLRVKYDKEVVVLEQRNAELKQKLNDYKYESTDKYNEFRLGFNRDLDKVAKSIKNFFVKND